jgi:ribosomal protein S18 acetylase RimI-like enzyme
MIGYKASDNVLSRIIPAFGHIDDKTPELAISVLPEYRNQGIGGELLQKLFELLVEKGYKQTSLSVQKENPALHLYQRMGYKIVCENDEDYIMIRNLEGM